MTDIPWGRLTLVGLGYVVLTNVLAIGGRLFARAFPNPFEGVAAFLIVAVPFWVNSVAATGVYVLGMLGVGVLAVALAWRYGYLVSVVCAAPATYVVHIASYLLLDLQEQGVVDVQHPKADVATSALFVLDWSIAGLVFAALAPAALVLYLSSSRSPVNLDDVPWEPPHDRWLPPVSREAGD